MKLRLSASAQADLSKIARESGRLFGRHQALRYKAIVDRAMALLLENPIRASSRERKDCGVGFRSFHLQLAAGRTGAASHIVFYAIFRGDLLICRVLPDSMEPGTRVARAFAAERRDAAKS